MRRLNLSPLDASVTMAGLGFGAKINILYSLFTSDPSYEEKLKKLREAIDFAERNSFVHRFVVLRGGRIVFVRREIKYINIV
jgi:hypothetical protein